MSPKRAYGAQKQNLGSKISIFVRSLYRKFYKEKENMVRIKKDEIKTKELNNGIWTLNFIKIKKGKL
jgi:hypothetical protein